MIASLRVVNAGGLVIIALRGSLLLHHRVRGRNGRQQGPGIGMHRMREDLICGAGLQKMAEVQYTDTVGNVLDHGQVVCNEKVRRAGLLLNILHEVHHLRLNGYVQCRDTLIRDDQLRVHDQRPGNADTLPLTAGELMGITGRMLRCETHLLQDGLHLGVSLLPGLAGAMNVQTLADDVLHLLTGIQGSHGILEDHLHLGPQHIVGILVQTAADFRVVEQNLSLGGVIEPDDGTSDGGLSGAGLAHEAIGLTGVDLEAHIVHGLHREALGNLEILLQPRDLKERLCIIIYCHTFLLLPSYARYGAPAPSASPPSVPGDPGAR